MTSPRHIKERIKRTIGPFSNDAGLQPSASAEDLRAHEEKLENLLDQLSERPLIRSFLCDNPHEAGSVRAELERLIREQETESIAGKKSSGDKEEQLLEDFRIEDAAALPRQWTTRSKYRKFLAQNYPQDQIPIDAYDKEAARLREISTDEPRRSYEKLKNEILQNWESVREARQKDLEEQRDAKLNEKVLQTMEDLISRFEKLKRLIGPIQNYLAFSWGLSSAILHESLFEIVKKADEILKKNDNIRRIAEKLGRLQQAEQKYINQRLQDSPQADMWAIWRAAKSSLVGVRESDDISNIISSEAALLSSRETENLFYLKFAEKKLLTYDYQAEERSQAFSPLRKPRKSRVHRRGPVIIAVDTSGSMKGEAEENAKALAFALTRIALSQSRAVHVINFSSETESITLSPSQGAHLEKLIQFLLMSFYGGTEIEAGLTNALSMLEEPPFRQADVVFLTDGEVSPITPAKVVAMNAARAEGVRFYTIMIGDRADESLLGQFDFNWRFQAGQLLDLAMNLEKFRRSELGSVIQ